MDQMGDFAFTRDLTVWPCVIDDLYGDLTWGTPVLMKCWFEQTNEAYTTNNGEEKIARYSILLGEEDAKGNLGDDYYIAVDVDLRSVSDPTTVSNTFKIGKWGSIACDALDSLDVYEIMV